MPINPDPQQSPLFNYQQFAGENDVDAVNLVDGVLVKIPAKMGFFARIVSWWRNDHLKTRLDLAAKVFEKHGGLGGMLLLKDAGFDAGSNLPLKVRELKRVFVSIDNRDALEARFNFNALKKFDAYFYQKMASNQVYFEMAQRMLDVDPRPDKPYIYAEKKLVDAFFSSDTCMKYSQLLNNTMHAINFGKQQSENLIQSKSDAAPGLSLSRDEIAAQNDVFESRNAWMKEVMKAVKYFNLLMPEKTEVAVMTGNRGVNLFQAMFPDVERRLKAYETVGNIRQVVEENRLGQEFYIAKSDAMVGLSEKVKSLQRDILDLGGRVLVNEYGFDVFENPYDEDYIEGIKNKIENSNYRNDNRSQCLLKEQELDETLNALLELLQLEVTADP